MYPVTLTPDAQDGGFVVTFVDIPEAITQGDTEARALAAAKYALESALDFYFEDKRVVPPPSKAKRGQHVVELAASLSAKVLLLNEMVTQNVRPAELARRLNTSPQEVNRLTNVKHTTRIDGIASFGQTLGHASGLTVQSIATLLGAARARIYWATGRFNTKNVLGTLKTG